MPVTGRPRAFVAIAAASLASFAGPYATGQLKDTTGDYRLALLAISGALATATTCTLLLPRAT
jgi:hypothetical protein